MKEAIILAGGRGTRLGMDIPKAMIEINSRTILDYRINWLKNQGVTHFILALGYQKDIIKKHIARKYECLGFDFADEDENNLVGTAGAIKNAMRFVKGDKVFVTNVDDITKVQLEELEKIGTNVICLARFRSPFGMVHTDEAGNVLRFEEKPLLDNWASCGFYYLNKNLDLPTKGSIEYDVFPDIPLKAYKYYEKWVTVNSKLDITNAERELFEHKVLAFDVDGTITESGQIITDDMARELNRLKYEILFISGTKIKDLLQMVSSKLHRKHHLMGNSGAHYIIVNENNQHKQILHDEFSFIDKQEIIEALKSLKNRFRLVPQTTEEDQIQDRGSQITFSVLGRNANLVAKKNYDPYGSKRRRFVTYLKTLLGTKKYEFAIGGTTSIDITKKYINKGSSILKFLQLNKYDIEDIFFYGDQIKYYGNDFPIMNLGIKYLNVVNVNDTLEKLKKL